MQYQYNKILNERSKTFNILNVLDLNFSSSGLFFTTICPATDEILNDVIHLNLGKVDWKSISNKTNDGEL